MTVHMYHLSTTTNNEREFTKAKSAVQTWVGNWDVIDEELSFNAQQLENGDIHGRGVWRFKMGHTEQNMTNQLTTALEPHVRWFRLKYHACEHDDPGSQSCSWDDVYEYGVPSE